MPPGFFQRLLCCASACCIPPEAFQVSSNLSLRCRCLPGSLHLRLRCIPCLLQTWRRAGLPQVLEFLLFSFAGGGCSSVVKAVPINIVAVAVYDSVVLELQVPFADLVNEIDKLRVGELRVAAVSQHLNHLGCLFKVSTFIRLRLLCLLCLIKCLLHRWVVHLDGGHLGWTRLLEGRLHTRWRKWPHHCRPHHSHGAGHHGACHHGAWHHRARHLPNGGLSWALL
mmetsp:Transcript_97339/g.187723  ORF Transcript_97339/g.187723 Transcript_97339/m.187723 type:complete len:225 (+) Transcript_97339:1008-1682(+)